MLIDSPCNAHFDQIDSQCKQRCEQLLSDFHTQGNEISIELIEDLYSFENNKNSVFLLLEGAISHEQEGVTLFQYDEGDLIGLEQTSSPSLIRLYADSAVKLRRFDRDSLINHVTQHQEKAVLWTDYLIAEYNRRTLIAKVGPKKPDNTALGFLHFQEGQTIIEQGSDGDSVYSIVSGHADVFVNATKVGEINENEVFGTMALLTGSPRTATVIATGPSTILVVPRNQFDTLIHSHPNICLNLMEDMAKRIVALNGQLTHQENA